MDNKLVNQIACVLDNTLVNCLPHKTVAIHIFYNIQCSINTHSTMWSSEQLCKEDKADFNDYLILFYLDTYYVEKLQISVLQGAADVMTTVDLFEVESSGLFLMQLRMLFVLKFPVFDPRIHYELFLIGENSTLNLKTYILFHGKIMNTKEERIVVNLERWNMIIKIILSLFLSEHRGQQNFWPFPECWVGQKSYSLRLELKMEKEHCWEERLHTPYLPTTGSGCQERAVATVSRPATHKDNLQLIQQCPLANIHFLCASSQSSWGLSRSLRWDRVLSCRVLTVKEELKDINAHYCLLCDNMAISPPTNTK